MELAGERARDDARHQSRVRHIAGAGRVRFGGNLDEAVVDEAQKLVTRAKPQPSAADASVEVARSVEVPQPAVTVGHRAALDRAQLFVQAL
jgi:hypothetical protein